MIATINVLSAAEMPQWARSQSECFTYTFDQRSREITWNITAAIEVARRRPQFRVDIADILEAMKLNQEAAESIDEERMEAADLSQPIIVIPLPSSYLPGTMVIADGWHRMAKALILGLPHLRGAMLTRSDEIALRMKDVILI